MKCHLLQLNDQFRVMMCSSAGLQVREMSQTTNNAVISPPVGDTKETEERFEMWSECGDKNG